MLFAPVCGTWARYYLLFPAPAQRFAPVGGSICSWSIMQVFPTAAAALLITTCTCGGTCVITSTSGIISTYQFYYYLLGIISTCRRFIITDRTGSIRSTFLSDFLLDFVFIFHVIQYYNIKIKNFGYKKKKIPYFPENIDFIESPVLFIILGPFL